MRMHAALREHEINNKHHCDAHPFLVTPSSPRAVHLYLLSHPSTLMADGASGAAERSVQVKLVLLGEYTIHQQCMPYSSDPIRPRGSYRVVVNEQQQCNVSWHMLQSCTRQAYPCADSTSAI